MKTGLRAFGAMAIAAFGALGAGGCSGADGGPPDSPSGAPKSAERPLNQTGGPRASTSGGEKDGPSPGSGGSEAIHPQGSLIEELIEVPRLFALRDLCDRDGRHSLRVVRGSGPALTTEVRIQIAGRTVAEGGVLAGLVIGPASSASVQVVIAHQISAAMERWGRTVVSFNEKNCDVRRMSTRIIRRS